MDRYLDFYNQLDYRFITTASWFIVIYLSMYLAIAVINRRVQDLKQKHYGRRAVLYLATLLFLMIAAMIWLKELRSMTMVFSVIGAGAVIALQDLILSIAGWLYIVIRKPYDTGDRVEIGDLKGDVINIGMFQTQLLELGNWVDSDQSTGRLAMVPNNMVFRNKIYNYTRGFEFIWNEISVVVTFESDFERGKEIMLSHANKEADKLPGTVAEKIRRMSRKYLIYYEKYTPIVYTKIVDSGIKLTLRYLCEAKKRRSTQDEISLAILTDFDKEKKVTFAYQTLRIVK